LTVEGSSSGVDLRQEVVALSEVLAHILGDFQHTLDLQFQWLFVMYVSFKHELGG
jgi:hypothetical protein